MSGPGHIITAKQDLAAAEYRSRLQSALGDQYVVQGLLAQGGMGAVYVARDRRLERDVAVKTLRFDVFPSHIAIERFQREAKALARLRHPNILPVYSVGEGDGLAYMITPRIEGTTLREVMDREGPLDPVVAARIGADVARALEAAHRLGIVHRDVKPENVLLEGEDRHVLLADFGIAKSPDEETALTATGMMVGSPRYMSPEQMAGDSAVGPATDVYALGSVLYEMVTGTPAFDGTSVQRIIMQKATTTPVAISVMVPGIAPALSLAIERCLEREPASRLEATALVRSLDEVGGSSSKRSPEQPASWLERRGLLISIMIALFPFLAVSDILIAAGLTRIQDFLYDSVLRPFVIAVMLVLVGLVLEMLFVLQRTRSRTGSKSEALRAAFGQPRWWLGWYPRRLRGPWSSWDRLPLHVRVLRTIMFVELIAILFAGPLLVVVAPSIPVASGAGLPLPLPLRVMMAVSKVARIPLLVGLAISIVGIAALSIARRQSPLRVVRHLTAA